MDISLKNVLHSQMFGINKWACDKNWEKKEINRCRILYMRIRQFLSLLKKISDCSYIQQLIIVKLVNTENLIIAKLFNAKNLMVN